ncbi:unnamed protein product [Mytilus coruscus]|uniref:Uncharacterized protein n=1 Tax=Mytilus coruscus TaxID=42192 RepID=A0A6J8BWU6_MYTCO|nr:unnamed protein product [Mytilus coruscus]
MSQISDFEQLLPILDKHCLSNFDIILNNQMALNIFEYVRSKNIKQEKMCEWFKEITRKEIDNKLLVTLLHRLKLNVAKQRGNKKTALLSQIFYFETRKPKPRKKNFTESDAFKTVAIDLAKELHLKENMQFNRKFENERKMIKKVRKEKKSEIDKLTYKILQQESLIKTLKYNCKKLRVQNGRQICYVAKYKLRIKNLEKNMADKERIDTDKSEQIKNLTTELTTNQTLYSDMVRESLESKALINKIQLELNSSLQTIDYLHLLLQDNKEIDIFDERSHAYTPEFRQVVMRLTSKNVATENVTNVINDSLKLAGKCLKQVPTRKTIDNIVTEKVVVSNVQVGQQLSEKKNTTLYSDETRKFGKTYNSFFISDEQKNIFMLGLREMHNKAASTTLDTLKEILMDISEVCDRNLENNEASHGNQILCNMRDFMSDRAKTNLSFSKILVEYRMQIMPEVIDGWDNFDDEQKDACSKINNFFLWFAPSR